MQITYKKLYDDGKKMAGRAEMKNKKGKAAEDQSKTLKASKIR